MFASKFDAEGLRFEIVTGDFNQIYYISWSNQNTSWNNWGSRNLQEKVINIFTTYLVFKPGIFLGSNNLELQDNLVQKLNGASPPE